MSRKWLILGVLVGLVAVGDQATKYLAVSRLTTTFDRPEPSSFAERVAAFYSVRNLDEPPAPGRADVRKPPLTVIPGFWSLKYVENPGAAWGLLSGIEDRFRLPFFHLVSAVAILFITLFYRRLQADQALLAVALSLVLGGAVGNYIDRLARNYVIDFVDWHWKNQPGWHWPTFNLADSAICVGVSLMVFESVFWRRPLPLAIAETVPAGPPAALAPAPNPDTLQSPPEPPQGRPGEPPPGDSARG